MSQNTQTAWEDIVFEKRNKEYGAYSIRMSYSDNVLRGTLVVGLFVAMLVVSSQFRSAVVKVVTPVISDDGGTIFLPPPRVQPNVTPATPRPRVPKAVIKNSYAVTTQPVEEKPQEQTVTVSGSGEGDIVDGPVEPLGSGAGLAVGTDVIVAPPENKVHDIVEIMPSYEGGLSEMSRFLQRRLKYPASARRQGVEGTVFVSFVVNGDGEVTDVKVIKGIQHDCDAEAARVIASMPKWKAGKQHNRFVSVRMVLPIKFALAH
jgi:protein TonB